MYPVLFELGSLRLYSWGFMLAIAVLIAIWGIGRLFEREDYSKDAVFEMVILMVIFGLIGSSSLHYGFISGGIPGRPTNVFHQKRDRRDDMVRSIDRWYDTFRDLPAQKTHVFLEGSRYVLHLF